MSENPSSPTRDSVLSPLRLGVLAASLLLLTPLSAMAQGQWVSVGPGGGIVNAVVVDPVTPGILYAATRDAGVFRSTNGGATWAPARVGLPNQSVTALAINPASPATLYAGTTERVYVTTDSGGTWTESSVGLAAGGIIAIVIDPLTPATVYAAVYQAGIFRSGNAGASWTSVSTGLTNVELRSLAIDPASPSTLYAGTIRSHLFKTVNAGGMWTQWLGPVNGFGQLTDIAVDPQTPSTVFLSANELLGGGVYRSTNGGQDWTRVLAVPGMFDVTIDPVTPSRIYAVGRGAQPIFFVFASTNGGDTWTTAATAPKWHFRSVTVDPHAASTLYAWSEFGGGVHRSTDSGVNWVPVNSGLHALHIAALALDPNVPSTVVAAGASPGGGAVFRSVSPAAGGWSDITNGLPGTDVTGIAIDPQDPLRAYVATGQDGVYRTTDGGATWTPASAGLASLETLSVAIDPSAPSTLYASTSCCGLATLYRSIDAGANWVPIAVPIAPSGFLFHPQTPAVIYAYGSGLHRSTNGGNTWTELGSGQFPGGVTALAIDPVVPTTLYVGVPYVFAVGSVFRSTDDGATWAALGTGLQNRDVSAIALDPQDPSTIYAGTADREGGNSGDLRTGVGVFRSTDGGATWAPFNSGLTTLAVAALAITPQNPSRLYAATFGGSVFRYEPATPAFGKISPFNGAVGQSTNPTLGWGTVPGATGYEVCVDTSNNGACDGVWTSVGVSTSGSVAGLIAGLTYYWQVRAVTAGGILEANFGAWWRFAAGLSADVTLLRNGDFSAGTAYWLTHATPDPSYLVWNVSGGVFQYYRVPPPLGTSNQAVIFQQTGAALDAGAPLVAEFDLGNSSSARKRISVLILDADFSDLSVCTFWLPANAPLATYQMKTHTTKPWANAAIYFYAATAGADDGFLRLDNVSLTFAPALPSDRTDCVDPTSPAPPGGAAGATLVANGDFSAGLASWSLFGQITHQIAGGVFQFYRPPGTPAGVVFQSTGQAVPAGAILTATLELGNSSAVRKRVTVLLHDASFADLAACTFWLAPGQPLSAYAMRAFATQAWSNATLSVYPATVGLDQWIRLDNVALRRTPSTAIVGTECVEPAASPVAPPTITKTAVTATLDDIRAALVTDRLSVLDLRTAHTATLSLRSHVATGESTGRIEVSLDGVTWTVVSLVPAVDDWSWVDVDLSDFAGRRIAIRFVLDAVARPPGEARGVWLIDSARVWIRR